MYIKIILLLLFIIFTIITITKSDILEETTIINSNSSDNVNNPLPVLPKHLQIDNDNNKHSNNNNNNNNNNKTEPATIEQLIETSVIREEIKDAIKNDSYVVTEKISTTTKSLRKSLVSFLDSVVLGDATAANQTNLMNTTISTTTENLETINIEENTSIENILEHPSESIAQNVEQQSNILQKSYKKYENYNATKIYPSIDQLIETADLRDEINAAIENDYYAITDGYNETITKPTTMKSLFSLLNDLFTANEKLNKSSLNKDDKNMVTSTIEKNSEIIKPNVIESVVAKEYIDKLTTFSTSSASSSSFTDITLNNREILTIPSIYENLNFNLGENVLKWKIIKSPVNSERIYFIGMTIDSLLLIVMETKNETFRLIDKLKIENSICCLQSFNYWHHIKQYMNTAIIIGIKNYLIFLEINEITEKIEIIWKWQTHKQLTLIEYLSINKIDILILISETNPLTIKNIAQTTIDFYKINLNIKDFWLLQIIPIKMPTHYLAILNTDRDYIIAIPQENHVNLYRYVVSGGHDDDDDGIGGTGSNINDDGIIGGGHFQKFLEIQSKNVQNVIGFQMGGYSYLAISGFSPQILRYYRGQFYPQTVLAQNWGLVEEFLPIPVRTYRDDLILLIQHRIYYDTHSLTIIDALIWNGEAFDVTLSIPCSINGIIENIGVTCILDIEREEGIFGSAALFLNKQLANNNLSLHKIILLVPRYETHSGLFNFNIELISMDKWLKKMNEIEYLKIYNDIENTFKYHEKIIDDIKIKLKSSYNSLHINESNVLYVKQLETNELEILNENTVQINEIFVGADHLWTNDDFDIDLELLDQLLNKINEELNAINTTRFTRNIKDDDNDDEHKKLYINKLYVKHLNVDIINDNILAEDLLYLSDGNLQFNGTLKLEQPIEITDEFRILDNESELIGVEVGTNQTDNRLFINNLYVDENIEFETINNIPWYEFVNSIIMTNLPEHFEYLKINGSLIVENEISMDYLNDIEFPNGFVLQNSSNPIVINGIKNFQTVLEASEIDCIGNINGINTLDVISLNQPQNISGSITFHQIEVSEGLEVHGKISGKHLDEFLENPTLLQTQIIKSACLFYNVYVNGSIYVMDKINNYYNLDELLSDVIYKNEENPIICKSMKIFDTIETEHIEITSNLINDFKINDFFTLDTDQYIELTNLSGNILFDSLHFNNGYYDSINITELDENSIKTYGEQYTEAELIFEDDNDDVDNDNKDIINLDIENLEIFDSINNLTINDFVLINENITINNDVTVDDLYVEQLIVGGNIINDNNENKLINGIDLNEFEENRLSYTKDQEIPGNIFIENGTIDFDGGDLQTKYINDIELDKFYEYLEKSRNLTEFLFSPTTSIAEEIYIDTVIVEGVLEVTEINDYDFNEIIENVIWLNRPNIINTNVIFMEPFEIYGNLSLDTLNDKIFTEFINDLILNSNETTIYVMGEKEFIDDVHVLGDVITNQLNNNPIKELLTQKFNGTISNRLHIIGNVNVNNLMIQNKINSIYIRDIFDKYSFDINTNSHVIKDDINFIELIQINTLDLENGLNDIPNVNEFLNGIIRKDQPEINLTGLVIFKNKIQFDNDIYVKQYNDIEMDEFLNNIVFIDAYGPIEIWSDVVFKKSVICNKIKLNGNLITNTLLNYNIDEYFKNAIRLDLSITIPITFEFPNGNLISDNIDVIYWNDNVMSEVFTLHTEQNISIDYLDFSNVYCEADIFVYGTINDINLREARENTLMVEGNQYISAPTSMQSIRILNSLETLDTINNGIDLKLAIRIDNNDDIYIESPISLQNVIAKNLYTNDLISGINFKYWYDKSLWKYGRNEQIITSNWTINNLIVESNIINDNTTASNNNDNDEKNINNNKINNMNVPQWHRLINEYQTEFKNDLLKYEEESRNICYDLNTILKQKNNNQIYLLNYFQLEFKLIEIDIINRIFHFKIHQKNFLLVNTKCLLHIYIWNRKLHQYEKLSTIESGLIESLIYVLDTNKNIYFITNSLTQKNNNDARDDDADNSDIKCKINGDCIIWKFIDNNLMLFNKLPTNQIYSSLHSNNQQIGYFYVLQNYNMLCEYNLLTNSLHQQWILTTTNEDDIEEKSELRFLPYELNLGIALTNGKQLFLLKSQKRKKRTVDMLLNSIIYPEEQNDSITEVDSKSVTGITKRFFSDKIRERIRNATENYRENLKKKQDLKQQKLENFLQFFTPKYNERIYKENSAKNIDEMLEEVKTEIEAFAKQRNVEPGSINDTERDKILEQYFEKNLKNSLATEKDENLEELLSPTTIDSAGVVTESSEIKTDVNIVNTTTNIIDSNNKTSFNELNSNDTQVQGVFTDAAKTVVSVIGKVFKSHSKDDNKHHDGKHEHQDHYGHHDHNNNHEHNDHHYPHDHNPHEHHDQHEHHDRHEHYDQYGHHDHHHNSHNHGYEVGNIDTNFTTKANNLPLNKNINKFSITNQFSDNFSEKTINHTNEHGQHINSNKKGTDLAQENLIKSNGNGNGGIYQDMKDYVKPTHDENDDALVNVNAVTTANMFDDGNSQQNLLTTDIEKDKFPNKSNMNKHQNEKDNGNDTKELVITENSVTTSKKLDDEKAQQNIETNLSENKDNHPKKINDTNVGDIYADIEDIVKPIADEIADSLADLNGATTPKMFDVGNSQQNISSDEAQGKINNKSNHTTKNTHGIEDKLPNKTYNQHLQQLNKTSLNNSIDMDNNTVVAGIFSSDLSKNIQTILKDGVELIDEINKDIDDDENKPTHQNDKDDENDYVTKEVGITENSVTTSKMLDAGKSQQNIETNLLQNKDNPLKKFNDTNVGDIYAGIEDIVKPIADEIADSLADLNGAITPKMFDVGNSQQNISSGIINNKSNHTTKNTHGIQDKLPNKTYNQHFQQLNKTSLNNSIDMVNNTVVGGIFSSDLSKNIHTILKEGAELIEEINKDIGEDENKPTHQNDKDDKNDYDYKEVGITNNDGTTSKILEIGKFQPNFTTNLLQNKDKAPINDTNVGDIYADIEDIVKPIADEIADSLADLNGATTPKMFDVGNVQQNISTDIVQETIKNKLIDKIENRINITSNQKTFDFGYTQKNSTNYPNWQSLNNNTTANFNDTEKVGGLFTPDVSKTIKTIMSTIKVGVKLIDDINKEIADDETQKSHHKNNKEIVKNIKNIIIINDTAATTNSTDLLLETNDLYSELNKENLPIIHSIQYDNDTISLSSSLPSTTENFKTNQMDIDADINLMEPKISKEIIGNGIVTAENYYLPSKNIEEIIILFVGMEKRQLVAISSWKDHVIQEVHDVIRLYEDILDGKLYQTLLCYRPTSLTAMHLKDETILAFIENKVKIQVYIYRGIQGFTQFTSFKLPNYASSMTGLVLPNPRMYSCPRQLLAVQLLNEIWFLEAKALGNCGIDINFDCN